MMKKILFASLMSVSSACLANGCDDLTVNFTNRTNNEVRLIYMNESYDNTSAYNSRSMICNKEQCSPEVIYVKPFELITLPTAVNSGSHTGVLSKLFFKINNTEFSSMTILKLYSHSVYGVTKSGKTSINMIEQPYHYMLAYNILNIGDCKKEEPTKVEVVLYDKINNSYSDAPIEYPDL